MLRSSALVVLATYATLATVRAAPHDDLYAMFKEGNIHSRYSDDVFEDAKLNVPDLIRKYRYPVEIHTATTPDGYILEMHRIPHGRDQYYLPHQRKPVVFLMHGLLCSSAGWLIMGPGISLAYILADEGFDVWMGNARGTLYSRNHTSLNPNSSSRNTYWQFSWDEIGNIDLPTMIDYALQHTGKQGLHYIGHSQGTTVFFVMGSLRPEYNQKIISMHALAPVAYMAHNRNRVLQFISPHAHSVELIASLLGLGEFLPNNKITSYAGQALCRDEVASQQICSNFLFLIGGWNEDQHNATMLPTIMGHLPAGASVRQLVHYAQGITDKHFRRYDYGTAIRNRLAYGSPTAPDYDLSRITSPVFLHYSINDPLAEVSDVERLHAELGRPVGQFRVPLPAFTHIDFIFAIDVKELLYDRVIAMISAIEANTARENEFANN